MDDERIPSSVDPLGGWRVRAVREELPDACVMTVRRDRRRATLWLIDVPPGHDPDLSSVDVLTSPGAAEWSRILEVVVVGPSLRLVYRAPAGRTLAQVVWEGGPLRPRTWREVARAAFASLAVLHSMDLRHGRLRPGALSLLDGDRVDVDEMGIASLCAAAGTPAAAAPVLPWVSPEHLGTGTAVPSSDVFMLASALVFAARGAPAWGSRSTPTTVLLDRMLAARMDLSGVPAEHARLLRRCLAVSAGERPTAQDVAEALDPALPLRVAAAPVPAPIRPAPAARPPVATAAASPPSPRASVIAPAPVSTPPAAGRRRRHGLMVGAVGVIAVIGLIAVLLGTQWRAEQPVVAPPPAESTSAATPTPSGPVPVTPTPTATPTPDIPETTVTTRVNYRVDAIEDTEQSGTRWTAELCLRDPELTQAGVARRIGLYRLESGRFTRQDDRAIVDGAGRCVDGQTRVAFTGDVTPPSADQVDQGWGRCQRYRIVIPETRRYGRTVVEFCVASRLDSL